MFDELAIWLFHLLQFFFRTKLLYVQWPQHDPLGGGVNSALVGGKRGTRHLSAVPVCIIVHQLARQHSE